MAHSSSPTPVVPPSRVTPLDLVCFVALAAVLWWGAQQIAAVTHDGVPSAAPAHATPAGHTGH